MVARLLSPISSTSRHEKPFEDDRLVGMIDAALRQAESGARSEAVTLDIAARIESLSPRERPGHGWPHRRALQQTDCPGI